MTRTVKQDHTSDIDAKASAVALLAAADTLDVDPLLIRTTSIGARVGFSAPEAVYDESGLTGGIDAPNLDSDPVEAEAGPVTITATFTRYDPENTDNVVVSFEIDSLAPAAERALTMHVATYTLNVTTGYANDVQFAPPWTGGMITVTDDESSVTSGEQELIGVGSGGELIITLEVPAD